jgi:hypothetical protein
MSVFFDPLLAWPLIWGLMALAAVAVSVALWRGLRGWPLRALALMILCAGLANPVLQQETRKPLSDIVIMVIDQSASQALGNRALQTRDAVAHVRAAVAALPNTELREVTVQDGAEDAGTLAMTALSAAVAKEPSARIAGAILITDGQVHDLGLTPDLPAPLHVLLTGNAQDWDRRLLIQNAPAFAILGEEVKLILKIQDVGAVPAGLPPVVDLTIAVDADAPQTFSVPVGQDLELPLRLPHAGMNVLNMSIAAASGEITDRNNSAVVQINGVRDRLRVLLVSGEPHTGERVWRNLLKSDPSVDLVHFTILRPPEKQDDIPVEELALIAFPTRELFVEKIKDFDLIIFDRFAMRGLLPMEYIDNVVQYVEQGGTVLVAAGPEYGSVDSLWRTPMAQILPAEPTGRVINQGFLPKLTDLGLRHPVTADLVAGADKWGRWFRMNEVTALRGQVVMTGPEDRPLLILDRVGQGRVGFLASDQVWLWGRDFEGGGPQLELLRRLAHWMLKEPDLEEDALLATAKSDVLTITRRTLSDAPLGDLTITAPDGRAVTLPMVQSGAGQFALTWAAPMMGLYRLKQGDLERVVAVGPAAPREFAEPLASADAMKLTGGVARIEAGLPDLRAIRAGRNTYGRDWLGITPRGATQTIGLQVNPLLPPWAWAILAALTALGGWLMEGRRRPKITARAG